MRSKTSFFNAAIYRHTLKRFWPLWGAYAMILFIITPLRLMGTNLTNYAQADKLYLVTGQILRAAWTDGCVLSFIMAAATAMAVFGYLYNSRLTGLMTSLPVKRGILYISVFSAGLTAMLCADILVFVITILTEAGMGLLNMAFLWQWLAITVMMNVTFYGFAAFCAMLTGNIVVLPLVYAVLQLTAWAVEQLVRALLQAFVFGMTSSGGSVTFLSPLVMLASIQPGTRYVYDSAVAGGVNSIAYITSGQWWMLIAYCAAGAAFAALGLLFYRKRRMETSSDVVAVKALRPAFKYCLAAGCALVLGVWLVYVIFGSGYSPRKFWLILLFTLAGEFIGYFAADMLIKKTFRVFSGNWKGFAILSCGILALMLCCRFDVFGYEAHYPDAAQVESVSISVAGDNVTLKGADNIAGALAVQRSIVGNKAENAAEGQDYNSCTIIYTLKNGRSMIRSYPVKMTETLAADPNSDLNKLQTLLNTREAIESRKSTKIPITEKNIANAYISYYDTDRGNYEQITLTPAQAEELYSQAILPDVDSGTLGRIWLMTSGSDYYAKVYALSFCFNLYDASAQPTGIDRSYSGTYYDYFETTLTVDSVNALKWLADNTDIVPVMAKTADEAQKTLKDGPATDAVAAPAVTPAPAAATG